jgi:spermidine synthase
MMVVQATSPYHAKESYLCIKRTLEAARFHTLPYHENVPSFGDWGWLMGWKDTMAKDNIGTRIQNMTLNAPTRYLSPEVFKRAMVFGKSELDSKNTQVNTLMFPILLNHYLKESWLAE